MPLLAPAILLLASLATSPQTPATPPPAQAANRPQAAATALLTLYNPDTGLFNTTGWWNSANAITALADESRLTGDKSIRATLQNTFRRAPARFPGFLNNFYDDEGWWALAWIDTYDLIHNPQYLQASAAIFEDMSRGWDDHCGGGIWWSKDRRYKNAVANELFLQVAAQLALHTHGRQRALYLGWANREWRWLQGSGMINPESLVNDGLDASCRNNGKTTWSYNQGVILGGLVALSQASSDPTLLPTATKIATAAITQLTDPAGILHDPCEPICGADGVQFKGIFARNLAQLQHAAPDTRFRHFLEINADTLWSNARTPGNRFSIVWSGPPDAGNAGAQTSALDLLNAAAGTIR